MGAFLRKYGTGTGADVYVPVIKRGVVDFAVGADWTPASGDVKVSIDGGAAANIGTLPTAIAMGNTAYWKFVFADAELQGKVIVVTVADSATKAVEDQAFVVETYGHASAKFIADLSLANLPANVTQWLGTAPLALSSQQVQAVVPTTQKVDVETIKTQTVTCSAGVTVSPYVGSTGAAINGTNANTLSGHDPGATLGTSTLTQTQVTGGAYALNSASFAFNAAVNNAIADQVWDEARSGHATAGTFGAYVLAKTDGDEAIAAAATALSTAQWTSARAGYLDNINNANLATVPAITGDAYARLGAPAGASVSADIAAVKTDTGNLVSRITSTLFSGITQLSHWLGMLAGKQAANPTALTEIKATGAGSGTYDPTTDSQEALRDNTGTAGAGLTAADDAVITAIAALNNISTAQVNAEVDTALSDWGKTGFSLVSAYDFAKGTVAMTESYAANGAAPTAVQCLMAIHQMLMQFGISGTNLTVKKLDNSTTAFIVTLDDDTSPTSAVRT